MSRQRAMLAGNKNEAKNNNKKNKTEKINEEGSVIKKWYRVQVDF